MSNINSRYDSLKKIYKVLGDTQLLDEGEVVKYDDILKNLYYLNLLVFKTYKIFSEDISRDKMIKKMTKLRDIDGNEFLDYEVASGLLDLYKDPLLDFYNHILKKREESQKGGYEGEEFYKNNEIYERFYKNLEKIGLSRDASMMDIIYHLKKASPLSIQIMFNGMPISEAELISMASPDKILEILETYFPLPFIPQLRKIVRFLSIDNLEKKTGEYDQWIKENMDTVHLLKDAVLFGPKASYTVSKFVLDWAFFPLYKIENLPLIGTAAEIPLDLIGVMIDSSGIIMEPLSHVIPKGIDVLLGLGSGIPIPGLNTALAGLSVGMKFAEKPIQYMIANSADLFGLYINVQRKQWGLAYSSLLEVIPGFASLMDATVTSMYTANKYMYKGVRITDFLDETISTTRELSQPFLTEPQIMFKPNSLWTRVIYPNRQRLPILRSLPLEFLQKNLAWIKSIFGKTKQVVNKGKKGLYKIKDSVPTKKIKDFVSAKKELYTGK